jgi:hypothetical protein
LDEEKCFKGYLHYLALRVATSDKRQRIILPAAMSSDRVVIVRVNRPGTDVMIFKIFSPKIFAFFLKTKLNYAKIGS